MCPLSPEEIAGLGFEEMVRSAQVAIAVIDAAGRVIYTNARARELTTRRLGAAMPADLAGAVDIFHVDGSRYERRQWPAVRSLTSGEEIVEEEYFYALADGARLFVRCSSSPVRDKHGEIVAAVLAMYDITERKNQEERLAYDASLLENVDDAVIGADREFRLTVWNEGAERLYGYAANEVLGRDAREIGSRPGDPSRVELESELFETGRVRTEVTAFRRDGTPVEVELIAAAVRGGDGEVTGYIGIHRDVSERKRTEKVLEMRASQQALLAELTVRNLGNGDLQGLLDDAVELVAWTLELEMVAIAELLPGGTEIGWRAGFGWSKEAIGSATPGPATAASLVGYTLLSDRPVVSPDVTKDERFEVTEWLPPGEPVSAVTVVIPGETQRFGVLGAASRQPRAFTAEDVNFMQAVADVIGVGIERSRLLYRLEEVRDSERRRIARDLHDDALTELTEALSQALLARSATHGTDDQVRWAAQIATLQRVGQHLRGAVYDLRLNDEDRPFTDLLRDLVEIHAAMASEPEIRLESPEALPRGSLGRRGTDVLRILGEALTNARRHSDAKTVTVDASGSTDALVLVKVSDDGRWENRRAPSSQQGGTGITGMIERADLLGADLEIEDRPGGGTVVSIRLVLGEDRPRKTAS